MSTEKTIDTTRGARGRASKKSIATRDVMTVAAMMVLTFLVCMVTGPLTMPFPFVYLYLCAGIQMFLCATFYLVVANRLNSMASSSCGASCTARCSRFQATCSCFPTSPASRRSASWP